MLKKATAYVATVSHRDKQKKEAFGCVATFQSAKAEDQLFMKAWRQSNYSREWDEKEEVLSLSISAQPFTSDSTHADGVCVCVCDSDMFTSLESALLEIYAVFTSHMQQTNERTNERTTQKTSTYQITLR